LLDDYFDKIIKMFETLEKAGIAHLDCRPENIMWIQIDESTVDIKLIDFEDVFLFGDVLHVEYIRHILLLDDKRYPFSEKDIDIGVEIVVSHKHNLFFQKAVFGWAKDKEMNFKKYMDVHHNDLMSFVDLL
jgi:hypothetical protein